MKRHGILMKDPLVLASMAGNKNQTRRLDGLDELNVDPDSFRNLNKMFKGRFLFQKSDGLMVPVKCPFGIAGDSIWIREAFNWQEDDREGYNDGWVYRAGHPYPDDWKWKPSLHMPYHACRLEYPIVSIRPERLLDISEADAKNEGVVSFRPVPGDGIPETQYKNYIDPSRWLMTARGSFHSLWKSVYGVEATRRNPWVWRIEYDPSKNLKEIPYLYGPKGYVQRFIFMK